MRAYDIAIIGAGPAGLTASIYGERAGYSCVVLDPNPMGGGQIINTYQVDNYPGLPGISGMELGNRMKVQAESFGAEFLTERVLTIEKDTDFILSTDKDKIKAKAVILAMGAKPRELGVKGESDFRGAGVSYCATCDGAFFRNKDVAVIGGGDTALTDAIFLSRFASAVYLIHRRDEFRAAASVVDQALKIDKIKPIYNTVVDSIEGDMSVSSLHLRDVSTGKETNLSVRGVFIAVGTVPVTSDIAGLPEMDMGYIVADETGITSVPGIFAAGDIRTKKLRQVVTAASDGANAITSADAYIRSKI
jgi:thioredoxin reductase (NADPH)